MPALLVLLLCGCYDDGPPASSPSRPTQAIEAFRGAEDALRAGDLDDALAHAESAVAADPTFDEAVWLKASLLGRSGRLEEALGICTELTARSPNFVQAHLLEGILWDQSGDLEAACRSYDEVLKRYEARQASGELGHRDLLLQAVVLFLRHGELEGVKAVNRFLEQFPGHPAALYVKACMQQKERGFLLRWFSEGGDASAPPAAGKDNPRMDIPGAIAPAGAPNAEKE